MKHKLCCILGNCSSNLLSKGIPWLNQKDFPSSETTKKNLELTSFAACNSHWMLVPPKAYKKVKGSFCLQCLLEAHDTWINFILMVCWWHVGFPNLFITLTCNPNWPEIRRLLMPLNLKATDRPDILSRVFKLKYEQMLSDLTKNHLLGKVVACKFLQIFPNPTYQSICFFFFLWPTYLTSGLNI